MTAPTPPFGVINVADALGEQMAEELAAKRMSTGELRDAVATAISDDLPTAGKSPFWRDPTP